MREQNEYMTMQVSSSSSASSHQRSVAAASERIISSDTNRGEGGNATSATMPAISPTAPTRLMRM